MNTVTIPWTADRRRVLVGLQRRRLLHDLQRFAASTGVSLFVVGGTTRDVCLARHVDDIDVALAGDVMAFARAFANALGAAYVPLDAPRGEARVVYRKRDSIDFARLRGGDIVDDLRQRDFTINALACPLTTFLMEAEPAFIDPLGGWPDLQARLVRMASPHSFADDPVRLLRAFRLAAVLEFTLAPRTQEAMPPLVSRLAATAAERIQSELVKLFTARQAHPQVVTMAQLGLLDVLFPELVTRATPQHERCREDLLAHALYTHRAVETLINTPASVVPTVAELVSQYVQMGERAPLLKWAALLHGIGPATAPLEGQETLRPCSSDAGRAAEIWQQVAGRLKLSRARTDYVSRIIVHHRRPFELVILDGQGGLAPRLVYQWFKALGEDVLGSFVLAIGEAVARQREGPHADDVRSLERVVARLWEIYRGRILPVLQGPRLVTGDDLQRLFGLSPGPFFKPLLEELEIAQVEGHIGTRDEALQWLQARLPGR